MSTTALEARLVKAVGSRDPDFLRGMLRQLIAAGELGHETDDYEVNFLLSVVEGVEPRDVAEAMLAAQMAMVHVASVRLARRFNRVTDIAQQDSAANAFNKLMRTFTTQRTPSPHPLSFFSAAAFAAGLLGRRRSRR